MVTHDLWKEIALVALCSLSRHIFEDQKYDFTIITRSMSGNVCLVPISFYLSFLEFFVDMSRRFFTKKKIKLYHKFSKSLFFKSFFGTDSEYHTFDHRKSVSTKNSGPQDRLRWLPSSFQKSSTIMSGTEVSATINSYFQVGLRVSDGLCLNWQTYAWHPVKLKQSE